MRPRPPRGEPLAMPLRGHKQPQWSLVAIVRQHFLHWQCLVQDAAATTPLQLAKNYSPTSPASLPAKATRVTPLATAKSTAACRKDENPPRPAKDMDITQQGLGFQGTPVTFPPAAQTMASAPSLACPRCTGPGLWLAGG